MSTIRLSHTQKMKLNLAYYFVKYTTRCYQNSQPLFINSNTFVVYRSDSSYAPVENTQNINYTIKKMRSCVTIREEYIFVPRILSMLPEVSCTTSAEVRQRPEKT